MDTDVLPGDTVAPSYLPIAVGKKTLKVGPGLRHLPPATLKTTIAGCIATDPKKNAVWIEHGSPDGGRGGRYTPTAGDLVVATVLRSMGEYFSVQITPHASAAVLPHLAFEGASKKTRPQLHSGDLVYARVLSAGRQTEVEMQCFNENTGKSEGMGPLKGGMVFDVSCAFARRLMMGNRGAVIVLEELSEKCAFEVAVGRNGRVWVQAESVKVVVAVGRALVTVDEEGLNVQKQKELVGKLVKGL